MDEVDNIRAFIVTHKEAGDKAGTLEQYAESLWREIPEGVVLATCSRLEVYYTDPRVPGILEETLPGWALDAGRILEGIEAVRHLFRVAAGLESPIIGEHEILGQVRRAWLRAREEGKTGPLLDLVFHRAMVAGRRARSETGIGHGAVGYPEAAVEAAAARLGSLDGRRIAIVGAGQAGVAMLVSLCSKYQPASVDVYNRTVEKAVEAAGRCGRGRGLPLEALPREPGAYDALLVALGGGARLPEGSWRAARVIVDISKPPAVEGPKVVGFSEVEELARANMERRRRWIPAVEEIIEDEIGRLMAEIERRRADRAIQALMDYASREMEREIERILRNLDRHPDLRSALEAGFSSYTRRLLHPLFRMLRDGALGEAALHALEHGYNGRGNGGGRVKVQAEKA